MSPSLSQQTIHNNYYLLESSYHDFDFALSAVRIVQVVVNLHVVVCNILGILTIAIYSLSLDLTVLVATGGIENSSRAYSRWLK
jgi:hypothetical protein